MSPSSATERDREPRGGRHAGPPAEQAFEKRFDVERVDRAVAVHVAGATVARVTAAREFRYDNPRQRYMSRDYDVSSGNDPPNWTPNDLANWTDYDGMMPYLDFDLDHDEVNTATFDDQTRYLAGMGIAARQDDATGDDEFLHGDLIRSTVMTTDNSGTVAATVSYTAFGQLVTSSGIGGELATGFPRYAYAGGWGYESDLLVLDGAPGTESIVLQHVGASWYQPDTGRFIMRDPIGIDGGLNVYAYEINNPVSGGGGGAKQKHNGRGDDPLYDLSEDELKKLYDDTPSNTKEGKKLRGKIKTIQKHKRLRNIAKRGVGKVAKKVVGRIVPVVGAFFFIYDWHKGGFWHVAREAVIPF